MASWIIKDTEIANRTIEEVKTNVLALDANVLALDANVVAIDQSIGNPNGIATLDGSGKLTASEVPSALVVNTVTLNSISEPTVVVNGQLFFDGTNLKIGIGGAWKSVTVV